MTKKADKKLLRAVLEPRKDGAIQQIAEACAAGADANGICPECSTSTGFVRGGSTLLTHAIHEWSSRAVESLLESGADPNLVDQNGWTPWMASTLVDESKRDRIQASLSKHGAEKTGEHIGRLVRAVAAGNVDQVAALIESDQDFEILSTFRLDLVGHQLRNNNAQMLELLLERKMTPNSTHLVNAIRSRNLSGVDLLLRYGLTPEDPDEEETSLMDAAAMGDLAIVQRLVEAGADVNRSAHGNIDWTPAFYARDAGKTEVAEWLTSCMDVKLVEQQEQINEARDPKFRALYEHATASESMSTDDIVKTLNRWDEKYGVSIADAGADRVTVHFSSLPENIDSLYEEIAGVCPDVAEDKRALQDELTKTNNLFLWWD